MKIYVSHSSHFDFKNLLYAPLKNSGLSPDYEFILPHELSDAPYDTKKLFENRKCDLILAEVSLPSTGQGIELGWANALDIPIIAIHQDSAKISNSVKIICQKIIPYHHLKDILNNLAAIL